MNPSCTIREATPDDKITVLDLLNRVFSVHQHFNWKRDEKFWHWKYESNIFGKTIVCVIENNNEIIGCDTLWPWKFTARGEVFKVYQPCDTVIHPAHQGRGFYSHLLINRINLLKKLKAPFAYNFPNQKSLPGNLKFGWQYLSKLPWMIKVLHPLGTFHSIKSKEKSNSLPLNPEDAIDSQSCKAIVDESVYLTKYISTYRQQGFFEWRYEQHPYFNYGQVIVEKGRRKAGAIFSINQKENSREMIVVDLLGNPTIKSRLFDQIQFKAKEYDVDFIVALHNKYYQMNALWKKGYIKVRKKNMVILPFDIRIEDRFTKYENWNPIASMHDSV